jgi:hypothetical protein
VGQIIEKTSKSVYDSILLSPECSLNNKHGGKIFTKIEILSDFPGGFEKWFNFANKNFDFKHIISNLADSIHQFQDSVIVKFVVTRNGQICHAIIQKGNSVLTDPVIKLLKSSPNWKPGLSGNRELHSYRTLRIDVFIDLKAQIQEIKRQYYSYQRNND